MFLIEKLYLTYVLLLYNQDQKIAHLTLDYLRADEAHKQKQKGLFSKLSKILWSFRFPNESIESYLVRDLGYQLMRNQSKSTDINRVYKFLISNPMMNERIIFIKEEAD